KPARYIEFLNGIAFHIKDKESLPGNSVIFVERSGNDQIRTVLCRIGSKDDYFREVGHSSFQPGLSVFFVKHEIRVQRAVGVQNDKTADLLPIERSKITGYHDPFLFLSVYIGIDGMGD